MGKQLSRWTMAWFASALAFLVVALCLGAAGLARPGEWVQGAALAAVHLFALGWLCQMMLGALIQFTPVLCARPLARPGLSLPALLTLATGTALLAAGFVLLEGGGPGRLLLGLAPIALIAGFGLAAAMIGPTLMAANGLRRSEGRMVILALIALVGLLATGTAMALARAGYTGPPILVADALPLHILLGAGGFLSLAAFGVSYKLFAMFLLAPERSGILRRTVFAVAATALGLALGGAGMALAGLAAPGAGLSAALAAAAVALYLADILGLWRGRRRPQVEMNMQWSRAALVFLALTAALLPPAVHWGGSWAEAAVFMALAGWLSTLTLAQMIRIVSFLTWVQVFAPRIGRCPVPLVADLADNRTTGRLLGVWSLGVLLGGLALATGHGTGFRVAALILLAAALGLGREAIAIRRLRHLDSAQRPDPLPPLVCPIPLRSIPDDNTRAA